MFNVSNPTLWLNKTSTITYPSINATYNATWNNLWEWTDINSPSFGIAFQIQSNSSAQNGSAYVGCINVSITYVTQASVPPTGKKSVFFFFSFLLLNFRSSTTFFFLLEIESPNGCRYCCGCCGPPHHHNCSSRLCA